MIKPNNISYRDTAARIVKKNSICYRYIFNEYNHEYDYLMNSGLYQELTKKGLLIKHHEVELETTDPNVYKCIYPEQIPFQSYPFEWSSYQWKSAILAYLKINQISLNYGMILKDATPYNFYMQGETAVMFDTTSFIFFKENDSWIAYRQFCEEFLSPVALINFNGPEWTKLTIANLRGLKLKFVSKQLALKSWINLTTLLHIHFHSKFDSKIITNKNQTKKGFTLEKIKSLQLMILNTISKWKVSTENEGMWTGYYEKDIESKAYLKDKEESISSWLSKINANRIIDLGANTGKFSYIASKYAKTVISLEEDEKCVNNFISELNKNNIKNIYPLIGNLAEPSPSIGVLNCETENIYTRGKSDVVLALAVTHHLYFTNKFTFEQIKEILKRFSKKFLIVEFIKKEDEKIKILNKDRTNNLYKYNEVEFTMTFQEDFILIDKIEFKESHRILFMFELRDTNQSTD